MAGWREQVGPWLVSWLPSSPSLSRFNWFVTIAKPTIIMKNKEGNSVLSSNQAQADSFPLRYISVCAAHILLTQPHLKGVFVFVFVFVFAFLSLFPCCCWLRSLSKINVSAEEHLVSLVSYPTIQSFDCLEFLYVPIITRCFYHEIVIISTALGAVI